MDNTRTVLSPERKRIEYLDTLRIVATFFVVMIHTVFQNLTTAPVASYDWIILNIYDSLSRWAVPIFVMISGALFLSSSKSAKEIYRKNLVRILTAYIFWAIVYALLIWLRTQNLSATIDRLVVGRYHMWFLPMLGGLYLVTPILRKIAEDRNLTKLFLILGLVFAGIIPEIMMILSTFPNPITGRLFKYIKALNTNFYLFIPMGYTCYYLLGHVLNKKEISKTLEHVIYALGIIGLAVTVYGTYQHSMISKSLYTGYYVFTTFNVAAFTAAVFLFFKNHFNGKSSGGKASSFKRALAKYSFGVYLVHVAIIELLNYSLGINVLTFNPVFAAPVICISVTIVSFIISAVINHIPFLNKHIV